MPKNANAKRSGEHEDFVLFKKELKSGVYWYARFWDSRREKWAFERSTGVEVKGERENRARAEKKAREILKAAAPSTEVVKQNFIDFCVSCWTPDSKYAQEYKTDTGVSLSAYYLKQSREGLEKWVRNLAGFNRLDAPVDKINAADIADWRTAARQAGCGPRRLQAVEQAMRVPIRWAIGREELKNDPFALKKTTRKNRGAKRQAETANAENAEAGPIHSITFIELARILASDYRDARVLFAVACAACCGLRRGELRGLQFRDIDMTKKIVHVRRNIVDTELEAKAPKWESYRDVFFPDALTPVFLRLKNELEAATKAKVKKDGFVLYNVTDLEKPITGETLRYGFAKLFDQIGIHAEERKARQLSGLHALRHSYASLTQEAGISRLDVQNALGHTRSVTTDIYSHSLLDFEAGRAKLDAAILAARMEAAAVTVDAAK
jgi:integrase